MPDMSEVTGRIFASMWKSGRDEFRRTGVLDPTFAIWSRAGKSIAGFRVPFWDNALESQCWEVVRAACVFHDVKILLMLSQAWRADPSSSVRARDSETRREMVLALVVSRVGKFVDLWEVVCEIIRSPTGSIAGFDPDETIFSDGHDDPPLIAMLPIRKPNRRQHRAAERKLDELRALAQWFLIPPSAKIVAPESEP